MIGAAQLFSNKPPVTGAQYAVRDSTNVQRLDCTPTPIALARLPRAPTPRKRDVTQRPGAQPCAATLYGRSARLPAQNWWCGMGPAGAQAPAEDATEARPRRKAACSASRMCFCTKSTCDAATRVATCSASVYRPSVPCRGGRGRASGDVTASTSGHARVGGAMHAWARNSRMARQRLLASSCRACLLGDADECMLQRAEAVAKVLSQPHA